MKIQASEIKEGDVLVALVAGRGQGGIEEQRRVVLEVGTPRADGTAVFYAARLGEIGVKGERSTWEKYPHDRVFDVERPEPLTPVQRAGDALAVLLRGLAEATMNDDRVEIRRGRAQRALELLAEIDPPKPPTLEEAVELLRQLRYPSADSTVLPSVDAFLARVKP